jgi:erythromycin esterase
MKIQYLIILLAIFIISSSNDEFEINCNSHFDVKWVLENTKEIQANKIPELKNEDLISIGDFIGDARIVLLGEQSHGDGTTFLFKSSLIKYLHEVKGFNVIAFESDFFAINNIWDRETNLNKKVNDVKLSLYRMWAKSKQIEPLFAYIIKRNSSGNKLTISGFDSRHASNYSKKNYLVQLDSLVQENHPALTNELEYLEFKATLSNLILNEYNHQPGKLEMNSFFEILDELLFLFEGKADSNLQFWIQELKSLKANAKSVWSDISNRIESSNLRDKQMAANLMWLLETKFRNEKVIVWSANYHIAKNDNQISKQEYYNHQEYTPMGEFLFASLNKNIVNIAFTTNSGKFTDTTFNDIVRDISIDSDSFEDYLSKSAYNFGFINFRDSKLCTIEPFKMNAFGHYQLSGRWYNVFDGVLYIKEMSPSEF